MQVAVLTFDGFNEIDSFVAAHILNRLRPKGWKAIITSPGEVVTSMNGVVVHAERRLAFAANADAVIIGSGVKSREIAQDAALLAQIRLDAKRQLVASQCSGALLLARLGLLDGLPVCTDQRKIVRRARWTGATPRGQSIGPLSGRRGMSPMRSGCARSSRPAYRRRFRRRNDQQVQQTRRR
jgi:putative intracellular protease/amidase